MDNKTRERIEGEIIGIIREIGFGSEENLELGSRLDRTIGNNMENRLELNSRLVHTYSIKVDYGDVAGWETVEEVTRAVCRKLDGLD